MFFLRRPVALSVVFLVALIAPFDVASSPASRTIESTPRLGSLQGWNVVLITLDATNPARIGAYGGSPRTMPFFDSLARKGRLFMHAYTPTGSTSPAHATLLSGALPERHRVVYNGVPLAPDVFWLPEEFHKLGYVTVASTVAFFLHDLNKLDRGFDHFEYPTGPDSATRPFSSNHVAYQSFKEHCLPMLSPSKPFFALIHLKGGHTPVVPVAEEFNEAARFGVCLHTSADAGHELGRRTEFVL
jgi:hypothetical protein